MKSETRNLVLAVALASIALPALGDDAARTAIGGGAAGAAIGLDLDGGNRPRTQTHAHAGAAGPRATQVRL